MWGVGGCRVWWIEAPFISLFRSASSLLALAFVSLGASQHHPASSKANVFNNSLLLVSAGGVGEERIKRVLQHLLKLIWKTSGGSIFPLSRAEATPLIFASKLLHLPTWVKTETKILERKNTIFPVSRKRAESVPDTWFKQKYFSSLADRPTQLICILDFYVKIQV